MWARVGVGLLQCVLIGGGLWLMSQTGKRRDIQLDAKVRRSNAKVRRSNAKVRRSNAKAKCWPSCYGVAREWVPQGACG